MREVRLGVKGDGLVARVVTDHVALPAIDAHVFVDQRHNLLLVVQLIVLPNSRESLPYHVLCVWVCVCVYVCVYVCVSE